MTGWTFLTALVASATALWIAYTVYPLQKEMDRNLQIDAEQRKLVAQLVSALEELTIKVNGSNAVDIEKVPYFTDEIAAVDAAIGVVRVYDLSGLPEAADDYKKSVKDWRLKILNAKRKRPPNFKRGAKRPEEYAAAMLKVSKQFEQVQSCRMSFLNRDECLWYQGPEFGTGYDKY